MWNQINQRLGFSVFVFQTTTYGSRKRRPKTYKTLFSLSMPLPCSHSNLLSSPSINFSFSPIIFSLFGSLVTFCLFWFLCCIVSFWCFIASLHLLLLLYVSYSMFVNATWVALSFQYHREIFCIYNNLWFLWKPFKSCIFICGTLI